MTAILQYGMTQLETLACIHFSRCIKKRKLKCNFAWTHVYLNYTKQQWYAISGLKKQHITSERNFGFELGVEEVMLAFMFFNVASEFEN